MDSPSDCQEPHAKLPWLWDKREFVQPTASWVGRPTVLCGLRKHRCFDIHCKCHLQPECEGSSFSGCNPKSLELDGARALGTFNFHLTAGCAVDEESQSYIVNHSKDTTASIHGRISPMTTDEWTHNEMFHCVAVREQQVKSVRADTVTADSRQRTLHVHLHSNSESPAQNKRRLMQADVS